MRCFGEWKGYEFLWGNSRPIKKWAIRLRPYKRWQSHRTLKEVERPESRHDAGLEDGAGLGYVGVEFVDYVAVVFFDYAAF